MHWWTRFIFMVVRAILRLRYRVEIRGLEKVNKQNLPEPGGILYLPNHPAHIDPLILISYLVASTKMRPVPVEDVYKIPVIHSVFKWMLHAVPIPGFSSGSNSYKIAKAQQTFDQVSQGLKNGDSFLLYPSGRLQFTSKEKLGGASGLYEILKRRPEANVVLIRTSGLWGSGFGWGIEGPSPNLPAGFARGFKILLKNLIFFAPRRKVVIELEPAGPSFPRHGERAELNQYLEEWYSLPYGEEGEPLNLVSLSRWREELPEPRSQVPMERATLDRVPEAVRAEVVRQVARVAHRKPSQITPEMHLFNDLGLDSLDIAQLNAVVDRFRNRPTELALDMMTVGSLMAVAAGEQAGDVQFQRGQVKKPIGGVFADDPERPDPVAPQGKTIQEAFFRICDRMRNHEAVTDGISGTMTYTQLKARVILLAELFRKEPATRVGVLLPASIGVEVVILALLTAGKIPVMINWTLGSRYLEATVQSTGIDQVITSERFLNRLDNADLTPIHSMLVTLESLRSRFSPVDLARAKFLARKPIERLSGRYQLGLRNPDDHAAILFTSGTESAPKAVPLSHGNILSDLRAAASCVDFGAQDIFLSILPPFHSFGYSVTGLFPILAGIRAIFSPDPTASYKLAEEIQRAKATMLCGAPSFLIPILRNSSPDQLRSLRIVLSGAEKIPEQFFEHLRRFNWPIKLIEGYGVTECSPILTLNTTGQSRLGVGQAIPGVSLRIVDPESLVERSIGKAGLILAKGPNVFRSYLGNQCKWPFVEIEKELWYNTGDLGSLDEQGYLTLAGRLKRFVKIGGEMISLPAMEEALEEVMKQEGWAKSSEEAALAVVPIGEEGERPELHLIALVPIDLDQVNSLLKERGFSNLSRLSQCHQVNEMPLLGTGKIDYRTLTQQVCQTRPTS
jgi:acyl-CoA synthetase (AMP-forming)/AMP-acid ligase II/1-acyl-sn-glycerol-3-phosphate acyltransferase/acyl carrier protein